ncbi:hypothetical protein KY285_016277 [Solanum tuberosum]|nr:hypothetical protein KY284_016266 [Solanum tuberosum]KAH0701999.1 hypothetical protein KY285_016277 [Solanum tuberosum]
MSRTRASVSSYRGEAVPKAVIETSIRGRGRARARGHARGVAPVRGLAHGAVPARGKAREASPEPPVEIGEDQVPPKFGAPLFYETLLMMLCVLQNLSQGSATSTPHGAQTRVGAQTSGGKPLVGPAAAVGAFCGYPDNG